MKGKHCSGGAGLGQAVRSRWLDTKDEVSGIHAIQYVDTRVDIEDTRVDIEDTRVDIEDTREDIKDTREDIKDTRVDIEDT